MVLSGLVAYFLSGSIPWYSALMKWPTVCLFITTIPPYPIILIIILLCNHIINYLLCKPVALHDIAFLLTNFVIRFIQYMKIVKPCSHSQIILHCFLMIKFIEMTESRFRISILLNLYKVPIIFFSQINPYN